MFVVTATLSTSTGGYTATYAQKWEGAFTHAGYALAIEGFMNNELPRWVAGTSVRKIEVVFVAEDCIVK